MRKYKIRCPLCKGILEVQDNWVKMEIPCPYCHRTLRIPDVPKGGTSKQTEKQPSEIKTSGQSKDGGGKTNDEDAGFRIFFPIFLFSICNGIPMLIAWLTGWPRTVFWITTPLTLFCGTFILIDGFKERVLFYKFTFAVMIATWGIFGWNIHFGTGAPSNPQTEKPQKKVVRASADTQEKQVSGPQLPQLMFLGISVNEPREKIKAHLLSNRKFHPPEKKDFCHIGIFVENKEDFRRGGEITNKRDRDRYERTLMGSFWKLKGYEKAVVFFDFADGPIKVYFVSSSQIEASRWLDCFPPQSNARAKIMADLQKANVRNEALLLEYFVALQKKYGPATRWDEYGPKVSTIELSDGLVEFSGVFVNFYNKEAARERIQSLKREKENYYKRSSDI